MERHADRNCCAWSLISLDQAQPGLSIELDDRSLERRQIGCRFHLVDDLGNRQLEQIGCPGDLEIWDDPVDRTLFNNAFDRHFAIGQL